MEKKDKELLLKDLTARLPYGVKVNSVPPIKGYSEGFIGEVAFCSIKREQFGLLTEYGELVVNLSCDIVKPYLRPMSSMTTEERQFLLKFGTVGMDENDKVFDVYPYGMERTMSVIDFLNAYHFDYRGLIQMGLALEAPEGIY